MTYHIKNWDNLYENNRSRKVKSLDWVPVPNKHDGEGYSTVMAHPRASDIYTAWSLMLQVASKCNPRGYLVRDDGTALTPEALATKTRGKVEWFTLAFEALTKQPICWLEATEEAPKKEVEQETKRRAEKDAALVSDEAWLQALQRGDTYKSIDVRGEYNKMVSWCQVNGKQPNRRRLINWLNRADSPMSAKAHTAFPPWLQVKTLEEKLMRHPANRESTYHKRDCTDAQKAEFASLKAKLAELKEQNV